MIIGVLEDGEVRLFDDIAEVIRAWGSYPDDVASEVIVFYDADGVWFKPILSTGPKRWAGLRPSSKNFTLERSDHPDPTVDPLSVALHQATVLAPNRYFNSLAELRTRFPYEP